jgi:hypothetical protein
VANPAHVELVQSGADATWAWRGARLDLTDSDLSGLRLRGAMLDHANFAGARLVGVDFTDSRLQEANFGGAHLIRANLDNARCGGSSFAGALLCAASLQHAYLVRCDLSGANLAGADLESALLTHARIAGAILDHTKLVDADLHGIVGLDEVRHQGPCELGTHALLRFGHELPAAFLRGVGLSDGFIRYLPAIISSARPIDFCSIFICAASADIELARRLHNDLQAAGVRCWLRRASDERAELDGTIHLHDRSIVLCSAQSLSDPVISNELAAAARPGNRTVYLRLDEAAVVPAGATTCDFRKWTDFRNYVAAFDLLMSNLLR